MSWGYYDDYPPYVPVAERKKQAARKAEALKKKGQGVHPVIIEGRAISQTFWGKAWCKNLDSYSDYENRLPRGRTYVRNGSVLDLKLKPGEIKALVSGSSIYNVNIKVKSISALKWEALVKECTDKIDSLIELLQGKFSKSVMEIISHHEKGLFPQPEEIELNCSCYDYADMCKHVAAVLYGVGARLDEEPTHLFLLRNANHMDLISKAGTFSLSEGMENKGAQKFSTPLTGDLSSLFGIEIEETTPSVIYLDSKVKPPSSRSSRNSTKKGQKKTKANQLKKAKSANKNSPAKSHKGENITQTKEPPTIKIKKA